MKALEEANMRSNDELLKVNAALEARVAELTKKLEEQDDKMKEAQDKMDERMKQLGYGVGFQKRQQHAAFWKRFNEKNDKENNRTENIVKIYLESNTILTPALSLYQKLGFQRLPDDAKASPYERCNVKMELIL